MGFRPSRQVADSIPTDGALQAAVSRAGFHVYNPEALLKPTVIRAMSDSFDGGYGSDPVDELPFKTLTRDEAQALRAKLPMLSPWRVVAAQAVAGLICCARCGRRLNVIYTGRYPRPVQVRQAERAVGPAALLQLRRQAHR